MSASDIMIPEVLHGIDLTFREGTVNALVGPSGQRQIYDRKAHRVLLGCEGGSITVGGADIRDISAGITTNSSLMSQDNFLFDDTVREKHPHGQARRDGRRGRTGRA